MVARKEVKRPYVSTLRAAQARETRRAIVRAADSLFVTQGFGGTTIDAIAEQAGVGRKTVFTSVGGKTEALRLALEWAIAGDDEPIPVLERPHVKAAQAEPDARRILAGFADDATEVGSRVGALMAVLHGAAGLDAELRALADEISAQRLAGMGVLARLLEARGALRPELSPSEAAELLWLLADPTGYHRMVTERGWAPDRYRSWLADTLAHALLARGYKPSRKGS